MKQVIHLDDGLRTDSDHRIFYKPTEYHVVVRSKACEIVTMGGGFRAQLGTLHRMRVYC